MGVPAVVEKLADALCRFRRRHAVKIETGANRVVSDAQFPNLSAIDAVRRVIVRRLAGWRNGFAGWARGGDVRLPFYPPARIRGKAHDIVHRPFEFLVIVVRPPLRSHEPS
jgi:hypothetical protein